MVALVLLPGMDGTGDLFEAFAAELGREFENVVVVRYPVSPPLGYDALARFVRAALPREGPMILLGESFSGPIAVSLAASELSARIRGLVLCCTFARNPRPWTTRWRGLIGVLPMHPVPEFLLDHLLLGGHGTARLRAQVAAAVAKVPAVVLRARLRAIVDVDVSKELSGIRVPMLCLRATGDRLVPSSEADFMARVAKDVRVVDVDGPHCLLQARPVQSARLVAEFAKSSLEPATT